MTQPAPIVDIHAHHTPERYKHALRTKGHWYGLDETPGELGRGGFDKGVEERLADMDALGCDMQLVTPTAGFYQYGNDLETTRQIARECNDEIAEIVQAHPDRFKGLATVPMQDTGAAVAELERAMRVLGLEGVMISDHVQGRMYDDPVFLPFFEAAEALGAIVFFHQGGDTIVHTRTSRYKLGNAIGNLTERALVFAALVFGGVIDRCPGLKPLLAHGGGYAPYGAPRMDKVSGAMEPGGGLTSPFPDGGHGLARAPSEYLSRFWYDCCTYSGPVLRFLLDTVGSDRVMLGTDYPAPMLLHDAVRWVRGLPELTEEEKVAVLQSNAAVFLGRSSQE